jgi:repressor LexA
VAAGAPILAQEHVEQTYAVEPSLFAKRPDYLLKVKGMSMKDIGIMDGDLLAVQSARGPQRPDRRGALGDEVTVKRFQREARLIRAAAREPRFRAHRRAAGRRPFAIEGLAGLIRASGFN